MFDYGLNFKRKNMMSFYERKLLRKYKMGLLTDNDIKQYIYFNDVKFGYPVGRISIDKRVAYYKQFLIECADDIFKDFNYEKKAQMKKRILSRVRDMSNVCFFTQTFNDDKLPNDEKAYFDYWRKIFSRSGINYWVLVSDYGKKKGRLHFHGFLDLSSSSEFVEQDGKYFHFIPLKSYGFNKCIFMDNTCLDKAVNYCIKYMFKDMSFESKHKLYGSRSCRIDVNLLNQINTLLGFDVKIL